MQCSTAGYFTVNVNVNVNVKQYALQRTFYKSSSKHNHGIIVYHGFCRDMRAQARPMPSCDICPSGPVTLVYCVKTAKDTIMVIYGMRIGNRTQAFA